MRKFPSHRVQEGGRGPWGDSACPDVTLLPQHVMGTARLSSALSHLPSPSSRSSSMPNPRCKCCMEKASWLKRQVREIEGFTNNTVFQRPAKAASGICLVTALQSHTSSGRRDIGPLPLVFLMALTCGSPGQREAVPDELYSGHHYKPQGLPPLPTEGPISFKKRIKKSLYASKCLEKMMSASYSVDPIN